MKSGGPQDDRDRPATLPCRSAAMADEIISRQGSPDRERWFLPPATLFFLPPAVSCAGLLLSFRGRWSTRMG